MSARWLVSIRWLLLVPLAVSALAQTVRAQTVRAQTPAVTKPGPVIFAAASLQPALDAIVAAWTARNGSVPAITYAGSGDLAKRIKAGARADVVIVAHAAIMDDLVKAGLIDAHTRRPILGNDLVLIAAADSRSTLIAVTGFDLAGAIGDGRLAVCAIERCAVGLYAKQALTTLKVWDSVAGKVAPTETNGATLAMVIGGEAKFGIVYKTDVKSEPRVKLIDIVPAATHDKIVYSIGLAKGAAAPDAARFEAYMRSAEATRILLAKGFAVLK